MHDKSMEGDQVFVGSLITLFVGNLAYACTETDLAALCGRFGVVVSVVIKRGQMGDSLSHGFVEFGSHAMASAAMMRLHNLKFMGRKLRCYWGNSSVDATTERDQNQGIQVHVGFSARQLQIVINEELLDLLFSQFGEVADVCIKRHNYNDRDDYKQRGYGFVYFLERRAAMLALLTLDKATLDGIHFECDLSKRSLDASMQASDALVMQEPKPVIRGPRELLNQQTAAVMSNQQQQQPAFSSQQQYTQQHSGPPLLMPAMMISPTPLLPLAPSLMASPQYLEQQVSPPMLFSHPMSVAPFPYGSGIPSPHSQTTGNYFPPPQPMGMWLQAPSPPMQYQQHLEARSPYHQQSAPQYIQQSPSIMYSAHHSPQYHQQRQMSPSFVYRGVSPQHQHQQFSAAPSFPHSVQVQPSQPMQPLLYPQPQLVNVNQQLLSPQHHRVADQSNEFSPPSTNRR